MISNNWGIGGYIAYRQGFSDFWDGLDGATSYNDIIVSAGLSATYFFK